MAVLGIMVGRPRMPAGHRYIQQIKRYGGIPESHKHWYLSENPCWYEGMDGRIFTCDRTEIVRFELYGGEPHIGDTYRISDADWQFL